MTFELKRYLARIGHSPRPVSYDGLAALQRAQLGAISFETIDAFTGTVPDLSPDGLWRKLILNGRGGWCLALNLLFGAALSAMGYASRQVLGRVRMGAPAGGPRAHLAHIVSLGDQRLLVDTGFGGPGPDVPLGIFSDAPVTTPLGTFRIRPDVDTHERVVERLVDNSWFALWGFDDVAVTSPDIEAGNLVCARWDRSPFPAHLMLNRVVGDRRNSLFDRRLTAGASVQQVEDFERFAWVLRTMFGLPLDEEMITRLWVKSGEAQAAMRAA